MKQFGIASILAGLAVAWVVFAETKQPADTTKIIPAETSQPQADSAATKDTSTTGKEMTFVTTKSGLQIHDHVVGTGVEAVPGMIVQVHYTGWLSENGQKGKQFDSSVEGKSPLVFKLGAGRVIAGWEEGIAGMKAGGKRTLIVPPALGYGAHGYPGAIPGNATLIFDVEFLGPKEAK